jgi:hypothetical protein
MKYLLVAVQDFDEFDEPEQKAAVQLMKLGRRRFKFLYAHGKTPPPLFGLSQISILLSALKGNVERIELLRELSSDLKFERSEFLIEYRSSSESKGQVIYEYASLIPVQRASQKRMHNGEPKGDPTAPARYIRWITLSQSQLEVCSRRRQDFISLEAATGKLVALEMIEMEAFTDHDQRIRSELRGVTPTQDEGMPAERKQRVRDIRELKEVIEIARRRRDIEEVGELCQPVAEWHLYPKHGVYQVGLIFSLEPDFLDACQDLLGKLDAAYPVMTAVSKTFYLGDRDSAALHSIAPFLASSKPQRVTPQPLSPRLIESYFVASKFDPRSLYYRFSSLSSSDPLAQDEIRYLKACAMMADVYKLLPGATISTLAIEQALSQAKWIPDSSVDFLALPQAFACVAMFESGICNIDPSYLSVAFAMSSGNSLYVAAPLACDPYERPADCELRRVVGNIGRAGITFLICPPKVKTRDPDPQKWMVINHHPFDGILEDNFSQTSIHLSFTQWEVPLVTGSGSRHDIDRTAILVESLVSVFEGGQWVGEIDVLKAIRSSKLCDKLTRLHDHNQPLRHDYADALAAFPHLAATSVENWDELIEAPPSGVIAVRAHKNWLARLAATGVCVNQGFATVIVPEELCWCCCARLISIILLAGDAKVALIC